LTSTTAEVRNRVEERRVHVGNGEIVEIQHAERDDVALIPSRGRLEEFWEGKRVGGDRVRLTLFEDVPPLVMADVRH
jgi:hypothetical protein